MLILMDIQDVIIGGRNCRIYSQQEPEYLLIQPTARHESAAIDREMELIASHCGHRFVMAAFWVDDWALGLMPWHDDAVSRREAVGQHGTDTLRYVCDVLMPWLGLHYGPLPVVLGGYSLGGLFALWASCLCEGICGVAAASPSVWIEGWMEFASAHATRAGRVYMSLGDREEHARNKSMARVGDNIRATNAMLMEQLGGACTTLEWNRGGHFGDEAARTARAFAWVMG